MSAPEIHPRPAKRLVLLGKKCDYSALQQTFLLVLSWGRKSQPPSHFLPLSKQGLGANSGLMEMWLSFTGTGTNWHLPCENPSSLKGSWSKERETIVFPYESTLSMEISHGSSNAAQSGGRGWAGTITPLQEPCTFPFHPSKFSWKDAEPRPKFLQYAAAHPSLQLLLTFVFQLLPG